MRARAASRRRIVVGVGVASVSVSVAAWSRSGHVGSPRSRVSSHSGRDGSVHQVHQRFLGRDGADDDGLDLFGDGHLDAVGPGQGDERAGALHPFGHHVHAVDDVVERPALAQGEAHGAVAALGAGAGGHEVAHAGQPAEGEDLAAQGEPEAAELGQAAGDEHRPRVVAQAEAVADARRDGHDVLGGAGDFAADDVGPRVGAEGAGVHQLLHPGGQRLVGQRHHAGGGMSLRHLAGQVGPGQHAGRHAGQDLVDHLGHAQVRPHLDALGQAHHRLHPVRPAAPCRSGRLGTRVRARP